MGMAIGVIVLLILPFAYCTVKAGKQGLIMCTVIIGATVLFTMIAQSNTVLNIVLPILVALGLLFLMLYCQLTDDPFGEKKKAAEEFAKRPPEEQERLREVYAAVLKEINKK